MELALTKGVTTFIRNYMATIDRVKRPAAVVLTDSILLDSIQPYARDRLEKCLERLENWITKKEGEQTIKDKIDPEVACNCVCSHNL